MNNEHVHIKHIAQSYAKYLQNISIRTLFLTKIEKKTSLKYYIINIIKNIFLLSKRLC